MLISLSSSSDLHNSLTLGSSELTTRFLPPPPPPCCAESSREQSHSSTSGFPKPPSPLLHHKALHLSTSRKPVADGEDDPVSFPDHQQLPPASDEGSHADASEPFVAAAHAALRWAAAQPGYAPGRRACHSKLAILAKHRRFDDARALRDEMRRASLASGAAVLLLVRRHCAARDVAAFGALPSFGFRPGIAEFHGLLSALCRYKNVQDVEHLLLSSEEEFSFEIKSCNIVLNGWCNMVCSVREAKRFWNAMESKSIERDVVSYGTMISCFSKARSLDTVMKLFSGMKEAGIVPDRKVYNAVVYALAKGRCLDEAKALVRSMEKGVALDTATYNPLIRPLCKARQVQEAREMFD